MDVDGKRWKDEYGSWELIEYEEEHVFFKMGFNHSC